MMIWILAVLYMCHVSESYKQMSKDDPYLNYTSPANDCHMTFNYRKSKKGIFSSPKFPDIYPVEKLCTYFFQAPDNGRIKISFDYFNLEKPSDKGCQFDFVEVFSVNQEGFKSTFEKYCGSELPNEFVSSHSKLEIVFKSDSTKNLHGFIGHFEFLGDKWHPFGPSSIGCGPGYLRGIGGEITSPRYPWLFPSESECTWIIKVKESQKVLLQIIEMEVNSKCSDAALSFFQGYAVPGMFPQERYCESLEKIIPGKREFLSTSSRVVVRFESKNIKKTKMKLTWTAVSLKKPGTCPGFMCRGSKKCENSRSACEKSPVKYCIDQSLRCNDKPNCGELDTSDEDMCLSKVLWRVLYAVVPTILIIIIVILGVLCYKRYKRRKLYIEKKEAQRSEQTHWVSPHIRSLEHSPNPGRANTMLTTSFVSLKHSTGLDISDKNIIDLDYKDKLTSDLDYQDSPVRENKLNEKAKENISNVVSSTEVTPKKENIQNVTNDNHKIDGENKISCIKNKKKDNEQSHVQFELDSIPNFRSHQKRSSYHLMQELNLGETEVMIAKI